jgi:hypothetical protein
MVHGSEEVRSHSALCMHESMQKAGLRKHCEYAMRLAGLPLGMRLADAKGLI